jgi:hypothetical protein
MKVCFDVSVGTTALQAIIDKLGQAIQPNWLVSLRS